MRKEDVELSRLYARVIYTVMHLASDRLSPADMARLEPRRFMVEDDPLDAFLSTAVTLLYQSQVGEKV